jgi:aromatic-L-amino-acid decarboxylase
LCVICFLFVYGIDDDAPGSPTPPTKDRLDQLNSEMVERINASGRAYLTQTKLRGRTVMRIGLGNVLTKEEHLRKGWELIQETATNL